MMDNVKIINNFISEEDISFFRKYIDENGSDKKRFRHRVGLAFDKGLAIRAVFPDEKPPSLYKDISNQVNKYSNLFIESCRKEFFEDRDLYFYGVSITRLSKDIQLRIHQDVHNDFSSLVYSGVLYLNDDYEGGEITFLDSFFPINDFPLYVDEMGGDVYKPKSGDIVLFPSDTWHGGKIVKSGTRDAIIFWCTLEKEYSFAGFDSEVVLAKINPKASAEDYE